MAGVAPYRLTMKSQEQRGASKPNIIELGFASDTDANLFAANLALCCSAFVVSVDHEVNSNYAIPYPAGTASMTRTALTDGAAHWAQMTIYDTPSGFAPIARVAALVAAGFYLVEPDIATTYLITGGSAVPFTPGPSY